MDNTTGCRNWALNRTLNPFTNLPTDANNPELIERCSRHYTDICHNETEIYGMETYEEIIRRGGVIVTIPSAVPGKFHCFDLVNLANDMRTRSTVNFRNPVTREEIPGETVGLVLRMDEAFRGVAEEPVEEERESSFRPDIEITELPDTWDGVYELVRNHIDRDMTRARHRSLVTKARNLVQKYRYITEVGGRRTRRGEESARNFIEEHLGQNGMRLIRDLRPTDREDALNSINNMGMLMLWGYVMFAFML
jgi:hypothetical protein